VSAGEGKPAVTYATKAGPLSPLRKAASMRAAMTFALSKKNGVRGELFFERLRERHGS
jgi:hypothetical protein